MCSSDLARKVALLARDDFFYLGLGIWQQRNGVFWLLNDLSPRRFTQAVIQFAASNSKGSCSGELGWALPDGLDCLN